MRRSKPKLAVVVLILVLAAIAAWRSYSEARDGGPSRTPDSTVRTTGEEGILTAFRAKRSGVWVEAEGEVVFLFRDDTRGSRHQMFLVKLGSGHTVKMSHNIDLALRVPIEKGDRVTFRGKYEYNAKGGVVHWTHHDPRGAGRGGWIEHDGRRYE